MKKIISCTLAASVAGTSLATINPKDVQAIENNLDLSNSINDDLVNVEIENTEEIIESESDNKEDIEDSELKDDEVNESELPKEEIIEDNTEEKQEESGEKNEDNTSEEEELIQDDPNKKDDNENGEVVDEIEDNSEEIVEEDDVLDEIKENIDDSEVKVVGKLELDLNFAMPLVNSDDLDILVKLQRGSNTVGIIDLSKGVVEIASKEDEDLSEKAETKNSKLKSKKSGNNEEGKLESGVTYKIDKYNYERKPLNDDESIYYIKVTFEGLERDIYSIDVSGSGYRERKVDNIEIMDYSKRVRLGNSLSQTGYNTAFLAGDINGDSIIDMEDYQLVFDKIGTKNTKTDLKKYDLNRDGKIDVADLSVVYENIGKNQEEAKVENTDKIIDINEIKLETNAELNGSKLNDILLNNNSVVKLGMKDGENPSEENPLTIFFDLSSSKRRSKEDGIEMEQIVIKSPENESDDSAGPSEGFIIYTDENGNEHRVEFSDNNEEIMTISSNNDIIIDLGKQVAVKEISINVTSNRGNKNISEIAKIEFLNNVYKEIPKPDMNIPVIKTLETSTEMHDERITISWEPEPNVTSYEVKYEKLNDNGQVIKTKKLQTNKTHLNILDKDISPYDFYRVSIQSLNGDWSSGYEEKTDDHTGYDGKPDNVDSDFNPIQSYYNGDKGSVTEVQVIPLRAPEVPRNLSTAQGYKSFTVGWENHRQARDFDVYYRKVGDNLWVKANERDENGNRLIVSETSSEVTNPNKKTLIRSHSYTINGLEDNANYEVRVTATNHLGTSKMSETYLASTVSMVEPVMSKYKLINRPTSENSIGTKHIINVTNKLDEDGWGKNDSALSYDSKYALVDGDFSTSWKVRDWDTGAVYGSNRGSIITFDNEYEIGQIAFSKTLEQGYDGWSNKVKITYWDKDGASKSVNAKSVQAKSSNGQEYYVATLANPIKTNKIKVDTAGYGSQTISELRFYEYDSLSDDIAGLYSDDLRIVIRDDVKQSDLDRLYERLNTKDPVCDEYHPNRETLLKELDNAQKLFNDQEVSANITTLDASIRTDNIGPSLGMENSYQSLGSVARPNDLKATEKEKIIVYMGSTDSNTKVDIAFLQNYGQPGSYMSKVYTISPGVTEIEIPTIFSADVEKGGQVMARVTSGSTGATVKIRLSGVDEIPHLNVNNMINDTSKVNEVKENIRTYIRDLKTYVSELPRRYPETVSDEDKINNIYKYEKTTSVLNTTDIEGDRFTLTLPATEILSGIEQGLNGNEDKEVERVYNALLAWEQEIQVGYAKKGVFEEVKDFNNNGEIDSEDDVYFNSNKAPLTRLNVKYQRMMMGAAAYSSSHHIGVGFGASSYIQGIPYKFDEDGNVTNPDEARLYGTLMGHEIGHSMDISNRIYPETSNNLLASITQTMLNEDNPLTSGAMNTLYEKVTSNTIGLSTNRSVVLGMLWQPYLTYEDNDTYKMLITDFDKNTSNDSYFAKLNRAYRNMSAEEKADGDRDQYLIRMTSKVAGRNLSSFYMAHGIIPNATTRAYVSQFKEETRPIQYINDEARRMRMSKKADMESDTSLIASFGKDSNGNKVTDGSYVNSKEVKIELSVDKSEENILGYEIYRNGIPCGFITRDKDKSVTVYTDTLDSLNNRVIEYKAIAYDYSLNSTNEVELGTVKVRHDGGVVKRSIEISSNTISVHEENNDIHSSCSNEDLKYALDNDDNTYYEGRMFTNGEYNSSVHESVMNPNNNPYIILDTTELKTLVGIKYTAPTEEKGLIFKKSEIVDSALKKFKIEVSKDGNEWTTVKTFDKEPLSLSGENPSATIYFDAEGVTGGTQLASYNARYVKITALGTKQISAAELELITPPGDNIEIGVAVDNINYENGIGLLKEDYAYQLDNPDTEENEFRKIPKGSVIITGEYRGNPAFNVPLVLNQNEEHIADKYNGLLFAQIPDNGDLKEISEGNWVYWVEPEYLDHFMKENKEIFAELYRTDTADASEGGQRLVSDTFKVTVPEILPEITLNSNIGFRASKSLITMKIDDTLINNISENR